MVPNYLTVVQRVAAEHPQAWKDAHTGNSRTDDFIKILAAALHAIDPKCGNNGKRGNPNDISDDAICYQGEGADFDPTNGNAPVTVIDVIAGAGGPSPQPQWVVVTNPQAPVGAAWIQPAALPGPAPGPEPEPTPPHECPVLTYPSYEDLGGDAGAAKITAQLEADYKRAGRSGLDGGCGVWIRRTDYDVLTGKVRTVEESIAKHRAEWCAALGIPVA